MYSNLIDKKVSELVLPGCTNVSCRRTYRGCRNFEEIKCMRLLSPRKYIHCSLQIQSWIDSVLLYCSIINLFNKVRVPLIWFWERKGTVCKTHQKPKWPSQPVLTVASSEATEASEATPPPPSFQDARPGYPPGAVSLSPVCIYTPGWRE